MSGLPRVEPLMARIRAHGAMLPDRTFVPLLYKGNDVIDLIHRLSTNDLRAMHSGVPVRTVFTTEKGRMIDHVEVVEKDGVVCIAAHAHTAPALVSWIQRYTISEDVSLDPASSFMKIRSVVHGQVESSATSALSGDHARTQAGASTPLRWRGSFGPLGIQHTLVPESATPEAGEPTADIGPARLTPLEYQVVRVALGIPSAPEELNDERNPLECGLRTSISFTKGCYIGQEVIARLDAYDKVQRELFTLAVLANDTPIPAGAALVDAGGEIAGVVTSGGGMLEGSGEQLLLAYLKRSGSTGEGSGLRLLASGQPLRARIVERTAEPWWPGSVSA